MNVDPGLGNLLLAGLAFVWMMARLCWAECESDEDYAAIEEARVYGTIDDLVDADNVAEKHRREKIRVVRVVTVLVVLSIIGLAAQFPDAAAWLFPLATREAGM